MNYANRMNALKPSDIREVMKMIAANPGTISFAGGLPDPKLFPGEAMRRATDKVLREQSEAALQYGLTLGYVPLRQKVAGLMAREGVVTGVDNIAISTGSQQAISLSALVFLNAGEVVLTENPSYLGALTAFKTFETDYISVDSDESGMKPEDLEAKLVAHPEAKLIYVIPNFQNPTGRTWSLERRQALVALAVKYDRVILEDNAYGEVRFDGSRLPSLKSMDPGRHVVHMGSFSKVLSPGLRVGWICAHEDFIKKYELVKYGCDLQPAELAQMQVNAFLEENDFDAHLETIKGVYKRRRDLMLETMGEAFPLEARYDRPEGGMFIWVELPSHVDTKAILPEAIKRGVAYIPGESFYPLADRTNAIRLNFSTMEDDKIVEGIQRLGALIKERL